MNDFEKKLAEELKNEPNTTFSTPDQELFKRAVATANVQQGSKDLLALGMASIWVVFANIFIKILHPIFKNTAQTRSQK